MKKIVFFAFVLSLFAFTAQGTELKIGYVNLKKAINESDKGKEAKKTLKKFFNTKKAIIDEKASEIEKLQKEIEKQASILTPESKKEKEDQIQKLVRNYQRMSKDSDEELQKKNIELTQKIVAELRKVINKIGEEEGYSAIFEITESGILYIPQELDITDKVIERYNGIAKTTESKK